MLIARAQRKAIRLTNCRYSDDGHRHVQILNHPPDDGELLRVLLAEIGAIRSDDIEQLCHNSSDAPEMSGSKCAAQVIRQTGHVHKRQLLLWIQFGWRRSEYHVNRNG